MKRTYLFAVIAVFFPLAMSAQSTKMDTVMVQLKIKELNRSADSLKAVIVKEDKNRDASINGVSPDKMEILNDRQDSLCLALRSQLVEKQLRIEELKKSLTPQPVDPNKKPAATLRGALRAINPNKK